MTFLQIIDFYKKKYNTKNELVIFELIFFLSKIVKTKQEFILNSNKTIDFNHLILNKKLKQYFIKNKPLAHIIKQTKFCNLFFKINKKVLAPRDVTEWIVTNFIQKYQKVAPMLIYDLCCGSGVIGITIKKYCPQHKIVCVDNNSKAIKNAFENAAINQVQVEIKKVDCFIFLNNNIAPDLIISNPPYISAKDEINKKILRYENKKALYAKNNGLYFYQQFQQYLLKNNKCKMWFEIGFNQYNSLLLLFSNANNLFYSNFYSFLTNNYVLLLVNDKI